MAAGPAATVDPVAEEGSADEADGEMMGTPGRNAEKPRSPSPFGAQDAIEEGKEGAAKLSEGKEASKKTASHGGYLRGTLASDTRAKMVKANAQE